MKQAVKEMLKIYHLGFSLLRGKCRAFFPERISDLKQLQKDIIKNTKRKDPVFFVQVGSNDGIHGDPLHDIIIMNNNWKGILIEPVGFLFERLKNNYGESDRFIFENTAIAPSMGVIEFFYVSEKAKKELGNDLPDWYDQLGSFDKNHILKHLDGRLAPYILSEKIDALTLQNIFDKHKVTKVDLIHIDTEGYDYKVLSSIDFSRYKPSVILYEHIHLSEVERKSAISLLRKNGYSCFKYGVDTLATI